MAILIKGKVVDNSGFPISGVEVYQKNSPEYKVFTDINGNFEIITSGEIDFKKQEYYVLQKFDGRRVKMTTFNQPTQDQPNENNNKSSNGLIYLGLAFIAGLFIYKSKEK